MTSLRSRGATEGKPGMARSLSISSSIKSLQWNSMRDEVKTRIFVRPPSIGKVCIESFFKRHFERRMTLMRSSTSEACELRTRRSVKAGRVRLSSIDAPDARGL